MSVITAPSPARISRTPLVPNCVLAMWLFLFTEVMFFCALISGYIVLRAQASAWPPPSQPRFPVWTTALNSVALLASGVTMWIAVVALKSGKQKRFEHLLRLTFVLGLVFLLAQGIEWVSLLGFGLTTSSSLYGSLFYTLVGSHGLHVAAALLALGYVWWHRARWDASNHAGMVAMRLYWLFVVAIWPPLYGVVYLW